MMHIPYIPTDNRGQAASECIIVSVFLLIPLFLIIPLLGKYIDIKHAAINQARFEAWEYTVWDGPNQRVMNDIRGDQSAGARSFAKTRAKGINFFFSDPTADTYGKEQMQFQENPLWLDHRGDSLFVHPVTIMTGKQKENKTPDGLGGVLDFIFDIMNFVTTAFGDIMKFVHVDAKFDAIYTKGYFTSDVNIDLRSIDDILPAYSLSDVTPVVAATPLHLSAKASVLTNSWNSGSTENTTSETRGLVYTALLNRYPIP